MPSSLLPAVALSSAVGRVPGAEVSSRHPFHGGGQLRACGRRRRHRARTGKFRPAAGRSNTRRRLRSRALWRCEIENGPRCLWPPTADELRFGGHGVCSPASRCGPPRREDFISVAADPIKLEDFLALPRLATTPVPFGWADMLQFPPRLEPRSTGPSGAGVLKLTLEAREAAVQPHLLLDHSAPIRGHEPQYLGPAIEVPTGSMVRLRYRNAIHGNKPSEDAGPSPAEIQVRTASGAVNSATSASLGVQPPGL